MASEQRKIEPSELQVAERALRLAVSDRLGTVCESCPDDMRCNTPECIEHEYTFYKEQAAKELEAEG